MFYALAKADGGTNIVVAATVDKCFDCCSRLHHQFSLSRTPSQYNT